MCVLIAASVGDAFGAGSIKALLLRRFWVPDYDEVPQFYPGDYTGLHDGYQFVQCGHKDNYAIYDPQIIRNISLVTGQRGKAGLEFEDIAFLKKAYLSSISSRQKMKGGDHFQGWHRCSRG